MHHTNYLCDIIIANYQHPKIQVFDQRVTDVADKSSDHCKQFLCISLGTGFRSNIFLTVSYFCQ